jgi:Fanconi anemia group J protein
VNELEIRLKREYNDEHQSEKMMSGREWYDAQAFRSLFQATGRCIRHARDYGALILIDQRFTDHIQKFPRWMKGSIQSDIPVVQIVERLSQFYVEMKQRFPPRQILNFGRPLILSCAACGSHVMNLTNLSDVTCQTLSKREGLLSLLNCSKTDGFLFLRKGDQTNLMASISVGEICFCRSDLSGYSMIVCSCGVIIGAKLSVGTVDDIPLFDGIWFHINRVSASQSGTTVKLDTVLFPKATFRLSMEGKGQQILACVADG